MLNVNIFICFDRLFFFSLFFFHTFQNPKGVYSFVHKILSKKITLTNILKMQTTQFTLIVFEFDKLKMFRMSLWDQNLLGYVKFCDNRTTKTLSKCENDSQVVRPQACLCFTSIFNGFSFIQKSKTKVMSL